MRYFLVIMLLLSLTSAALAEDVELRAHALGQNIRCMVCQGQVIEDSNAPLAKDLRKLVRERITAGDSDEKIIDDLRARYGDSIYMLPPVKPATALLWLLPPCVLLAGFLLFWLQGKNKGGAHD